MHPSRLSARTLAGYVQHTVAQNSRAQAAAALQRCFRSGTKRLVHPITGFARLDPKEPHPLHLELPPDERFKVHSARNHVAAKNRGRLVLLTKLFAQGAVNLVGEERDLAFEIRLLIEIPVTFDATPRHAMNLVQLEDGVIVRRPAVMPAEVVAG